MKKLQIVSITLAALLLAGCGAAESAAPASESASKAASTVETAPAAESESETPAAEAALPDGVYTADFNTDSSMFHANESCDGKGTLTVADGQMTMHVSLQSKKIVNLYLGMATDAADHEADWLQPTTDTVTYSDGTSEEVYGFDIPVAAVDTDFQLAILGTKGTWYDHTVSVANAQPADETAAEAPADGSYTCAVTLEGGSGRATVESPATLTVADGAMTATIVWSSPNYDYMLIDGEKYLPINTEGNSTFEIPVAALDTALAVTADTVAMSTPHEIDYTLTFASATLAAAE
ncbi:MAG: iron transporter [Subdoligranulum sp.]|nr:iron transporter [Subdoligranulum sp.]